MEELIEPKQLHARIMNWAEDEIRAETLPAKSGAIVEAVFYRGELPRGAIAGIVGTSDRSARRITSALLKHGVLTSKSQRAPLHLAFPATLAARWMPGVFPDKEGNLFADHVPVFITPRRS